MKKKDKILLTIVGFTPAGCKRKIKQLENYKIKRCSLFLEFLSKKQKQKVYKYLLDSSIKEIPFCHARNDMSLKEFNFLKKKFKTKYFNIHTNSFQYLNKWKGIHKQLLVEFSFRNLIPARKDIEKIKGFCIDLSHFQAAKERGALEYNFIISYKKQPEKFIANHLNGYSKLFRKDIHYPTSKKQLNYLTDLPKFLFGKYIALEMFNSIKQQLEYKDYAYSLIKNKI